ncbi:hypothetical protein Tco_0940638 [Tanacetum coccineum]|uniref:Uncharacterized protein n=1 Tax=Tanacetum coccineum TaxID=301880 RepID=A0ABQ5DQA3_9ASTR
MPPYEMFYGRRCRTLVCSETVASRELASTDMVLATTEKIKIIRERLKEAQDSWKSYVDNRRRKCLADESSVITLDDIEIDPELISREEPVTILGRKSRQLRNKVILLVKVEWKHRKGTIIIEQRVKVNQKARILELKRRNYEEYYFDIPYAVSIKEDTAYACPELHSASMKERSVHLAKIKVIKEESEIPGLLMIDDDLFTCDTPLGMIFNEFNRLSGMEDDLFTYEVKIHELSYSLSVEQQMEDLDNGNLDVYERKLCYDEYEKMYAEAESVIATWLIQSYKKQLEEYMEIKKQKRMDMLSGSLAIGKRKKYCNGGDLPKVIRSGDMIYFKSYEWYENLEDGELKDKALNCKAILE